MPFFKTYFPHSSLYSFVMKICRLLLIISSVVVLQVISATRCFGVAVSDPCDNPVLISSLIITNSVCGDSSGVILLNLVGGNSGYSFSWSPNVSTSNVAFGLKAAAYKIHIVRTDNPNCTLDTTVIVNNSNGPPVQVMEVLPANCLASNGKVTLGPPAFNYSWSNGETGAVNSNLPSGCYIVTATNPATGCYSVIPVCVPNKNPLQSSFEIIEPAKCGLPVGQIEVFVTGGSGQYAYSFGNTSIASDLAPGGYVFYVVDQATGCQDTLLATMTGAPLSGTVVITPHNIKCAGIGPGNVEFQVIPGPNFKMPFSFALWNQNGIPQSPGNLAAGTYFLQIADADSCLLPVDTFQISEPPAFSAQTTVLPHTCNQGGRILLDLSGGNGRYLVDWADIQGFDNPEDRLNLEAGLYSATVYDSLFCMYPIDSVLVPSYCSVPETLLLIVPANSSDTLCLMPPAGISASGLTYSVVSGQSSAVFGTWSLAAGGCVVYNAGAVPAFGVDPICVAIQSNTTGLSDTACIVVNITTVPAQTDSVYFAIQSGNSATACGAIPSNFNNRVVTLLDGGGLSGASDAFGTYTIDPVSACITFQSFGPTGYNVDNILVGVCDTVLRQCRVVSYFPTILSADDCFDGINLPDSLTLYTNDCNAGAPVCLPLPFLQSKDYVILDNGLPYNGGNFSACLNGQALAYTLNLGGAPYQLQEWTVGSQKYSGFFTDPYDLLSLMNQFDPLPGWSLENDSVFIGGNANQTYGLIKILTASNQSLEAQPKATTTSSGAVMRFIPGLHTVTFRRVQTGCLDTVRVKVNCTGCPPIHNYTPDNQGNITWNLSTCFGDTVFCTNLLNQELGQHTITDQGQIFSAFTSCGDKVGLRLDTGYHDLKILNNLTFCEYNIKFRLNCSGGINPETLLAVPDMAATPKNTLVEMDLVANDIIRGITGNRTGLANFEILSNPDYGQLMFDDIFGVVIYTPEHDYCGIDTFTYRITDTAGLRSSALVKVNVLCDKVLIYNGISPNGDNKNDVWHIAGIEQFPDNEVRIFNRWGNLVFERKGYDNQNAWDGSWNGRQLPDGAYFYIIDLGDGSGPLSGYLQIQR